MTKITTLLLDCDNTLVLSEELAFAACADLLNEIASSKFVPLGQPFTGEQLVVEFVGQNFRGMLHTLRARWQQEHPGYEGLTDDEIETYVKLEEDKVIERLKRDLVPCVGAEEALKRVRENREGIKMAVVSSSALRRLKASIEKVGFERFFKDVETGEQLLFSAASSLPKPTSKPDPAIYLYAMEKLGIKPEECVAVEDSKSGTLSGTRAGIKVIGYVGPYKAEEREHMAKVLREAGAIIVMEDWAEFEECLAKIESGSV